VTKASVYSKVLYNNVTKSLYYKNVAKASVYLNVTDFSYWSCHVHRSFLAWSQTSCTCGSYCTTMVFSKKVPEPESAP